MKTWRIALIPGDGIGKEVVPAGRTVLEAVAAADPTLPAPHPIIEEVRQIDLFSMTPLDALNRLAELQRMVQPPSKA